MAIAMTTGYSAQTEGALLCIEAASDWALMIGSLTLVLLRIGSGLGDSRCPASLHRDHRGAGDSLGAGHPLERAKAGLEGSQARRTQLIS